MSLLVLIKENSNLRYYNCWAIWGVTGCVGWLSIFIRKRSFILGYLMVERYGVFYYGGIRVYIGFIVCICMYIVEKVII